MARSVTLRDIANRARVHADMRDTSFIDDTEMLRILNEVYPELYDELVTAYENYYVAEDTLNIVTGNNVYSLPTNFYKLIGVDFQVNNDAYITLQPFMEGERNVTLTTNQTIPTGVIKLRYVPAPQTFTDLDEEVDGVSGWDRLLSLLCAIDMLDAEESDSKPLYKKYERTVARIRSAAAPRDAGFPARVVDVYKPNIQLIYGALRYRLEGNNIKFQNTEYLGADMYPPFL
jgi:hypothetical protein